MKNHCAKILVSALLLLVLIAASVLGLASCGGTSDQTTPQQTTTESGTADPGTTPPVTDASATFDSPDDLTGTIGQGEHTFTLSVKFRDGVTRTATIRTDEETVGDALQTLGIIDGEEGAYGLYIKSICGEVADYDVDQSYWAFYIDGAYAMTGADQTAITAGAVYSFEYSK